MPSRVVSTSGSSGNVWRAPSYLSLLISLLNLAFSIDNMFANDGVKLFHL